MNKKLLAAAVAGVFAAPVAAFAQSSVTISGFFSVSAESISIHNPVAARAGLNTSEGRLGDNSSRIIFNVVEDLGGGLRAVAQADLRFNAANGSGGLPPFSGNTHVGLRGNWGQIRAGLQDLHYGVRESYMSDRGDLRMDSISILSFVGAGAAPIANASRTPNTVFYDTPELWGGFTGRIAYSFSPFNNSTLTPTGLVSATGLVSGGPSVPTVTSNDINSNTRKGGAWNLNPNWSANGINVSYSYWTSKFDNPNGFATGNAVSSDQRSNRLAASYLFPMGFRIGLAWDKSKLVGAQSTGGSGTLTTNVAATAAQVAAAAAANGTTVSNRTAWSLPMSYTWGANEIHVHFDRAGADKAAGLAGLDTKANMFAVSYVYNLSKRTNVALGYAQINNGAAATYNFFTSTSLGSADAGLKAGEDPRLWSLTMRHAF